MAGVSIRTLTMLLLIYSVCQIYTFMTLCSCTRSCQIIVEKCPDPSTLSGHGPDPSIFPGHGPDPSILSGHGPDPSIISGHGPDPSILSGHGPDSSILSGHGPDSSILSGHGPDPSILSGHGPDPSILSGHGPDPSILSGHGPDSSILSGHGPDSSILSGHGPDPSILSNHGPIENKADIPDNTPLTHGPLELHHKGEDVEAMRMSQEIKVLCWILTSPENHDNKAKHVKATWGKRCNKLIFMSSKNDSTLGAIDIGAGEGREVLWGKTKRAFKYVYDQHLQEYDWFFKCDDDTYAIMENMRYMLSAYDAEYPIYFGSRFKKFTKQGYMSGGGGYVLSKAAVKKFVEEALPDKQKCNSTDAGDEDVNMGICLENVGVLAGDSRDHLGRGRFFPLPLARHLMEDVPEWYLEYVYYKPHMGLNCCSDMAVTFHYVSNKNMYEFDYLIYHIRPYGINHHDCFPALLPPPDTNSIPEPILAKRTKEQNQTDPAAKT